MPTGFNIGVLNNAAHVSILLVPLNELKKILLINIFVLFVAGGRLL